MSKPEKKLLDKDIEERFEYEKRFVIDPDHEFSKSTIIQIGISIMLVLIVMGSLIYTLVKILS
ncbi:hypothetical protein ABTQ33_11475 [Paucilactobacillus suebicus]|uniref:Uncharacterized protein n=1 Tax=Paucilactobacillus suebicus DSM 5007 = KCTC 3549 TaxID=1423807 RepID=A0A0R1VX35_9LACO|nr:hypothetical protein [Paucilactobacillus suebicus]KRM09935.1 hypothetical protein FD16_GL001475 [Paucilactobacillus suebicus DSM 5007 = KCTC 3549]